MYQHETLLLDEIEGAELDLGTTVTPTTEEQALLRTIRPQDTRRSTLHRLNNAWEGYPAGTLVLYNGQEVLLFLKKP